MMNKFCFSFSFACLSGVFWSRLLSNSEFIVAICCLFVLFLMRFKFIAGCLCGILWFHLCASSLFSIDYRNLESQFEGRIVSLHQKNKGIYRVDFKIVSSGFWSHKIRLYWKNPPSLYLGQRWNITYRPKPIHFSLNEGSAWFQKAFIAQSIAARGRVINGALLKESVPWRYQFIETLKNQLENYSQSSLMMALMAGDRSGFTKKHWDVFRKTGVAHLFAISGLHLAVVFGFVLCCFRFILNQLWSTESLRNHYLSLIAAGIMTTLFACLSGWSLSTQRAFIMLLCLYFYQYAWRYSSGWSRFFIALMIVLILDPLAGLSAGLWFSFGAIFVIFCMVNQPSLSFFAKVKSFVFLQIMLSLSMTLLQVIFFHGISVHSIWLNLLLVPLFSFFVIPFAFLSLAFYAITPTVADICFLLLNDLLDMIFDFLLSISSLSWSWWSLSLPSILWVITFFVVLISFYFLDQKLSWLGIIVLLTICIQNKTSDKNYWEAHVLDVGQGLAVVLIQNNRALIYDTGARYPSGFNYADVVIQPFLKKHHVEHVDYIVVSHADNDHAGGLPSLKQRYPQAVLIANQAPHKNNKVAHELNHRDQPCVPRHWLWHRLSIEILWPQVEKSSNAYSCVLKVTDEHHSVLLTGDINQWAEQKILDKYPDLKTDILLVPHHGSKTSSSFSFISQLKPDVAILSSGFQNYYGFPHAQVIDRYEQLSVELLNTARTGQVSFLFLWDQKDYRVTTYRDDIGRYWFNSMTKLGEMNNSK